MSPHKVIAFLKKAGFVAGKRAAWATSGQEGYGVTKDRLCPGMIVVTPVVTTERFLAFRDLLVEALGKGPFDIRLCECTGNILVRDPV